MVKENDLALIMKGGGIKGLAYVGALEELSKYYNFNWYVGTSAGGICAILLASGYTINELKNILYDKSFEDFKDANVFSAMLNLCTKGGMHKALSFKNWIQNLVATKLDIISEAKFHHLPYRATIYATKRDEDALVFDSIKTKDRSVAHAARCSMAAPIIFTPEKEEGMKVLDGGARNNYPASHFALNNPGIDFIGLYLGSEPIIEYKDTNIICELISLWTEAMDVKALREFEKRTIIIDPSPISTWDFSLTTEEKKYLLDRGKYSALKYLKKVNKINSFDEEFYKNKLDEDKNRITIKRRIRFLRKITKYVFIASLIFLTINNWKYICDKILAIGNIYGSVYDAKTNQPLTDFSIIFENTNDTLALYDSLGKFTLKKGTDTSKIHIFKVGYQSYITKLKDLDKIIYLKPQIYIRGYIADSKSKKPLRGARIKTTYGEQVLTKANGYFEILSNYSLDTLVASLDEYRTDTLIRSSGDTINIYMDKISAVAKSSQNYSVAQEDVEISDVKLFATAYNPGAIERDNRFYVSNNRLYFESSVMSRGGRIMELPLKIENNVIDFKLKIDGRDVETNKENKGNAGVLIIYILKEKLESFQKYEGCLCPDGNDQTGMPSPIDSLGSRINANIFVWCKKVSTNYNSGNILKHIGEFNSRWIKREQGTYYMYIQGNDSWDAISIKYDLGFKIVKKILS